MAGYVIQGAEALSGDLSISYAGDINGDGLADLLIGDSDSDTSFVVFGQTNSDAINLTDIAAGEGGFIIDGEGNANGSGVVVSAAGDVNGDGYDDLIVASTNGDSYIVYGGSEFSAPVNLVDGLTGTEADETIIGTAGNDVITANGGADVIYAGAGNDTILLNNDSIAHLNDFGALIDGGTGNDTLRLVNTGGDAIHLDLSSIDPGVLTGIERFDIRGAAGIGNTLTLSKSSLLSLQDENGESAYNTYSSWGGAAQNANKIQMVIDGDSNDTLNLTDMVLSGGSVIIQSSVPYLLYDVVGTNVQLIINVALNANIIQDATAPDSPAIVSVTDAEGSVTGEISSGQTSDDLQPIVTVSIAFTGVVAGDSLVLVDADNNELGRTVITPAEIENGLISVQTDVLPEGDMTIYAYLQDQAGNQSVLSTGFNYEIDTTATLTPTITAVTDSVGVYQGDLLQNARSDDTQLTLKVNIADINTLAGDTIILFDNDSQTTAKVLVLASDIANGFVSINSPELSDGIHNLTVKVQDAAGNLSEASAAYTVTIDTQATFAPTITSINDDKGIYQGDVNGTSTDDTLLTVTVDLSDTGAVEGDRLVIYINGVAAGVARQLVQADINKTVTIALPSLATGEYTITARIIDIAGNQSPLSDAATVTLDSVAPNAATIVGITDDAGSLTGNVLDSDAIDPATSAINGHYTDDTVLDLTIDLTSTNAVAGDSVWLYDNEVLVKQVVLTQAMISAKSVTLTTDTETKVALEQGRHDFTVTVVDQAGNTSSSSTVATVIVDTDEPSAPVIELAASVVADGASPQEVLAADGVLTITAEAYSTVSMTFTMDGGQTVVREFIATGEGQTINLTTEELQLLGLSGGMITVTATTVDQAGNVSAETTTSFDYTLPDTDLTVFETSNGLTIIGENLPGEPDYSGYSVSSAGDVNGDGLIDFIVGANNFKEQNSSEGRAYVVFGTTEATTVNLSDIAAGASDDGFMLQSGSEFSYIAALTGFSVSNAGDINGDGYADLLVSAPINRSVSGSVYIVYGKSDSSNVSLPDVVNGIGGFEITGEPSSQAGNSVSNAGDINGDGLADIIIGSNVGSEGVGKAYVIFGTTDNASIDLANLTAEQGFVITAAAAGDNAGYSVSDAGDVNGDGLDDVIVSASSVDKQGEGVTYVIYGKTDGTEVDLANFTTDTGFAITGESAGDISGYSVSSAGDVNGDGLADIVIGAPGADGGVGKTYVVFGKTNSADVNLQTITNGVGGFMITGESNYTSTGFTVSNAGDINGDGLSDIIITAMGADGADGRNYVVYGKTDTGSISLSELSSGSNVTGFIIDNVDHFNDTSKPMGNQTVSAAGDINGDGYADLLIGVAGNEDNVSSYVIFGGSQYTGAVTVVTDGQGTSADETVIGTASDDVLNGGGGEDVFYAGAGNDVIRLNNDNVRYINSAGSVVDGGTGVDTLTLVNSDDEGMTLDLTAVGNSRLNSIERFDITGSADNTLKMSLNDILVMQDDAGQSGFNAFNDWGGLAQNTNRIQLVIDGNSGDTLQLTFALPESPGTVVNNGITYDVYNLTDANVQLLVARAVTIETDVEPATLVTPDKPEIVSVTDDTGEVQGTVEDGGRTDDSTPTLRVSFTNASAGDKIQLVLAGGSSLGLPVRLTQQNIDDGYVDITTISLLDGSYSISAQLIATNGLQSIVSDQVSMVIDTSAPTQASIVSITDDVGNDPVELTDEQRSNDNTLTVVVSIDGTGVSAGDTIRLVDSDGNALSASYILLPEDITAKQVSLTTNELTDGDYDIGVQITDAADNRSAISATQAVTVDTTAPDAPVVILEADSDSGVASDDRVTNVTSDFQFSITGEADAAVMLFNDINDDGIIDEGELLSSATLDDTGSATITVEELTGTYEHLKVIQTDVAGNASAAAALGTLVIDTTAPTISEIAITDADKSTSSDYMGVGDSVTITISFDSAAYFDETGSAQPTLSLTIGDETVEASYVEGSGTDAWQFTYTFESGQEARDGLSIPANALNLNDVTVTDQAGNVLEATSDAVDANTAYKVDGSAPSTQLSTDSSTVSLSQGDLADLSITKIANGDYWAVWQAVDDEGKKVIYQQTLDSDLTPYADPVILIEGANGYDLGAGNPVVAVTTTGLTVVAYNNLNNNGNNQTVINFYDMTGNLVQSHTTDNRFTMANQPEIIIGDDGDVSVSFYSYTTNSGNNRVAIASFETSANSATHIFTDQDGNGSEQQYQAHEGVTLNNGNYAVAFVDNVSIDSNTTVQKIRVAVYDSTTGRRISYVVAPEKKVEFEDQNMYDPQLVVLEDGKFILVWIQDTPGTTTGLSMLSARFNEDGSIDTNYTVQQSSGSQYANAEALDNGRYVRAYVVSSNALNVITTDANGSSNRIDARLDGTYEGFSPAITLLNSEVNGQPDQKFVVTALRTDGAIIQGLFNDNGDKITEYQIGEPNNVEFDQIQVTATDGGNYLVSWIDKDGVATVQKFTASGEGVVSDTTAPVISFLDDTGEKDGDFVTSVADQTVKARLTELLGDGDLLFGSVSQDADGNDIWIEITDESIIGTYIRWQTTLVEGEHSIKIRVTDENGNEGQFTNYDYVLDTQGPVFIDEDGEDVADEVTLLFRENTAPENIYSVNTTDDTAVTYALSGVDAALFVLDETTGVVDFVGDGDITDFDFENPLDVGTNNTYNFSIVATDLAGNKTSQSVTIEIADGEKGDEVIELGDGLGKLIAQTQADGEMYYFWDVDGSGAADASDKVTYSVLQNLLETYGTGTENEIVVNAITMRLPSYGGLTDETTGLATQFGQQVGTAIEGNGENSTYDGLLALWDANNGTATTTNQLGVVEGWGDETYWTSTESSNGHATVAMYDGSVFNTSDDDTTTNYVAWQVM
jgi:hypothetical protein